ncbi:hypothetical protein SISSUDRAFT_1048308 [Sistotremastrum suecicum HHB10207 ss-3]|uniref:Uncharacterized protein n=1 Tax=Sistotremastrum suecicum HHB10207 ss-3 TaxID=1314776 RepID=A0A166CKT7_9AGAM|nr:hypothetical protein SISSUDRAFT_1048308 [Sistotremastrum suecicum HHB10207 ss-3]
MCVFTRLIHADSGVNQVQAQVQHDNVPIINTMKVSFVLLCLAAVASAQVCDFFPSSRTAASVSA